MAFLAHAHALRGIFAVVLLGLVVLLPVPVLGVPVVAALIGLLVGAGSGVES